MQDTLDIQKLVDGVADREDAETLLGAKPTKKYLSSLAPGIHAAQVAVDLHLTSLPAPDNSAKPEENSDDAVLIPAEKATDGLISREDIKPIFDLIEELRPRVRVEPGATADDIIKAVLRGTWTRNVMMLVPMAGNIPPAAHFAFMAQMRRQPWLGYHQEKDTLIQCARNRCVKAFLDSEAQWAWFVDADTIPPFGMPGYFYRELGISDKRIPPDYLKFNALERLLSRKKKFIGGTYIHRRVDGRVVHPVSEAVNTRWLNSGPSNEVIEVPWLATGCALIHRTVFTDIMARYPERTGPQFYDFFGHDAGKMGEDAAFGQLAGTVGHKAYLDLSVPCAHLGTQAFM